MVELQKLLQDKDISVCAICGMPFAPYHSRQKTCGSPRCKREWKNKYLRDRMHRERERDLEGWRKKHREAERRYRDKLKANEDRDSQLGGLQDQWKKQKEFDDFIKEHGHEYGRLSAEKLLAQVPKIDVSLGTREDATEKEM